MCSPKRPSIINAGGGGSPHNFDATVKENGIMAGLIYDKQQIEAAVDKIVDRTMQMDMTWDWP